MRLLLYGEKVSHTTHTLKDRYDANNDRTKVFNRPRVKGSDNRPKSRTQRVTPSVFESARYGRLTIADGEDTFAFEGTEPGPEAHITILIHKRGLTLQLEDRSAAVKPTWEGIGSLAPSIR